MQLSKSTLDKLPKYAGVYLVMVNDDVIYIGATMNLWRRLMAHRLRLLAKVGEFQVEWCRIEDWRSREAAEKFLIRYFRPMLNRRIPKAPFPARPEFVTIPKGWVILSEAAALSTLDSGALRVRLLRVETANQWGYLCDGKTRRSIILDPALIEILGITRTKPRRFTMSR